MTRNVLAGGGIAAGPEYIYYPVNSGIARVPIGGGSGQLEFIPLSTQNEKHEWEGEFPYAIAVAGEYLYWASERRTKAGEKVVGIGRAKLDGSEVITDFIPATQDVRGLAIAGEHIYWRELGYIARANLNGTDVEKTWLNVGISAYGFGLAANGSHIYWADGGIGSGGLIGRANLNGTEQNNAWIRPPEGASIVGYVAADEQHVYWEAAPGGAPNIRSIARVAANAGGGGSPSAGEIEEQFVPKPEFFDGGIAVTPSQALTASGIAHRPGRRPVDREGDGGRHDGRSDGHGDGSGVGHAPVSAIAADPSLTITPSSSLTFVSGPSPSSIDGKTIQPGESLHYTDTYTIAGTGHVQASVEVTGSYEGKPVSTSASTTATLTGCANGKDVELESVRWTGRHDHGLEIGQEVVVHGCNIQAGDVLRWGNDQATQTLGVAEVSPDGTTVTTTLPWSATTGQLSISDGSTTVTLAEEQTIDNWRNTQGFNFPNYGTYATRQEMVDAFADTSFDEYGYLPPALEQFYLGRYAGTHGGVGQCFGFALTSVELEDGSLSSDRYGPAATVFGLAETKGLDETIEINWWKQFSREYIAAAKPAPTTAGEIHDALTAAFGVNGFTHPAMIGFFWRTPVNTKSGVHWRWAGHEVTAFGVRDDYPNPGEFTILVYNSNIPFQPGEESTDGLLHAKAQANSNIVVKANGEWSDPGEGPYAHGVAERFEVVPASVLESPQHIFAATPGQATTVLSPGTGVLGLVDPASGKPVNLETGGSGSVRLTPQTDGETGAEPYEGPGLGGVATISGPAGLWHESLGSTGSGLNAEWLGSTGAASLSSASGFAASTFDSAAGSLALAPAAGEPSPSTATLRLYSTYSGGATEHILTVSGAIVGAGIKASFAGGGVNLSTTKAVRVHVELSTAGAHVSPQSFDLGTITIPARGSLSALPSSWSALAQARISALLSSAGHHRHLFLRNRLRPPRTRILRHSASAQALKLLLATSSARGAHTTVLVSATARHGRTVLGSATMKLAGSPHATVTLRFPRPLPKGTRLAVTLRTASSGETPSSSKATATVHVR